MYRASKFKLWKEMLMSGGGNCEATLKRMVKAGVVTHMYDALALPMPEAEKAEWQANRFAGERESCGQALKRSEDTNAHFAAALKLERPRCAQK